jgi:hypothetical protein
MRSTRLPRALALASVAAALAPAGAAAMPLRDPVGASAPAPAPTTIVREVPADDGGQTLALILSGAALVVAAGAAARTVRPRPATAGPAARTSPRPGAQPGR